MPSCAPVRGEAAGRQHPRVQLAEQALLLALAAVGAEPAAEAREVHLAGVQPERRTQDPPETPLSSPHMCQVTIQCNTMVSDMDRVICSLAPSLGP